MGRYNRKIIYKINAFIALCICAFASTSALYASDTESYKREYNNTVHDIHYTKLSRCLIETHYEASLYPRIVQSQRNSCAPYYSSWGMGDKELIKKSHSQTKARSTPKHKSIKDIKASTLDFIVDAAASVVGMKHLNARLDYDRVNSRSHTIKVVFKF